jgi:mannitol-1-phosphate 5-dehydrogenase
MKLSVQFGAGNIGRGFMGQLFWEAGYRTMFVEASKDLVQRLNESKRYPLKLLDAASRREIDLTIDRFEALAAGDATAVATAVEEASVIGTAVGVKNLSGVAAAVARGIEKRREANKGPVDIYLCENVVNAADILREEVRGHISDGAVIEWMESNVGFVGTVVARMVPSVGERYRGNDPLLVVADSYHKLPYDVKAVKAPPPPIEGMRPLEHFRAEVERKLYTYNLGHAALAYLGYLKGYAHVHEPFADAQLMEVFQGALGETCDAILRKYPDVFTEEGNEEIRADINLRFGNPMIQDTVYRVGRDPLRKLGPDDRLVGSAKLCMENGLFPANIASVCGAALCYDYDEDPDARRLQEMISSQGVEKTLQKVSSVDPSGDFGKAVLDSYRELREIKQHTEMDRGQNR